MSRLCIYGVEAVLGQADETFVIFHSVAVTWSLLSLTVVIDGFKL